jgi:hypothetical protein
MGFSLFLDEILIILVQASIPYYIKYCYLNHRLEKHGSCGDNTGTPLR